MPVMEIHLVEGQFDENQQEAALGECAAFYAEVLGSPMERVRVFVTEHKPGQFFAAGKLARVDPTPAPYFKFIVLEGRPVEQRHRLLTGFTDIIERVLGVERERIRGGCWAVPAEDWAIGGEPASRKRGDEIAARQQAASS